MKEKIKDLGYGIFGIGCFIGLALLAGLILKGGVRLSAFLYPWLVLISIIVFGICLFILLPLAFFKKTRKTSSIGLLIASFIFGATAWIWSFLIAYTLWGFVGLFIGLIIGGIGVVPIAMFAMIFNDQWSILGQLILLIILIFGFRFLSLYIAKDELS